MNINEILWPLRSLFYSLRISPFYEQLETWINNKNVKKEKISISR